MADKLTMSEAQAERIIDARVQSALQWDSRYRNAENAEDQAEAEATIESEIISDLEESYTIL